MGFIADMAVAAWIKFPQSKLTPSIMTVVLCLALLGMLMSIYSWAGHLFISKHQAARHQASHDLAAAALPVRGLPYDWHRVTPKGVYSSSVSEHVSVARSRNSFTASTQVRPLSVGGCPCLAAASLC